MHEVTSTGYQLLARATGCALQWPGCCRNPGQSRSHQSGLMTRVAREPVLVVPAAEKKLKTGAGWKTGSTRSLKDWNAYITCLDKRSFSRQSKAQVFALFLFIFNVLPPSTPSSHNTEESPNVATVESPDTNIKLWPIGIAWDESAQDKTVSIRRRSQSVTNYF